MEKKMIGKVNPLIFARAKQLRNNITDAEIILWEYLRTKPFGYKFRRQRPIQQFIADFYCYPLKLIIEADGVVHQKTENKISDEERDRTLNASDIKVIRFSNKEIHNSIETVIARIISVIQETQSSNIKFTKIPLQGGRWYESNYRL